MVLYAAAVAVAIVAIYYAWKRRGAAMRESQPDKAGFLAEMRYRPPFLDPLGPGRNVSRGYTTGLMPSIDTEAEGGWLCGGLLGVPV